MEQQTAETKLFIGIDIHKRSWKVHCSSDLFSGKTFSMEPEPSLLKDYVDKHFRGYKVATAYEAGCRGYGAHRCFESYGWKSSVVNPADIFRRGKERYTKTDRIDAQLIARELKDGRLEGIQVIGPEREQLRSLFRRRNDLVKDLRQIKSYIKMQLLYYGIKVPEEYDNDHRGHDFRNWLDALDLGYETGNEVVRSRMRSFRFVDRELRELSTCLRKSTRAYSKRDYMLLRSIPGIGGIVASGIIAELGGLRRFRNVKELAGYVGMCPGIYQSGDTLRHTGMSQRAHRPIRSYFIEASWQAIRTDPVMQGYYRKHQGRNVKSVIVKVARKLLSRTLAVIKTGTPYSIGVIE